MESNKKESVPDKKEVDKVLKRISLTKVVVDSPALLSLVKHCQDSKHSTSTVQGYTKNGVQGNLDGYIEEQDEILKITRAHVQIGPEEKKSKKKDKDNKFYVGFYVSCQQGLAFSIINIMSLVNSYRNFPNSVMIIYDINKSNYGLNPFQCFRLSKGAINALKLDSEIPVKDKLIIDNIRENQLEVQNFFEEVPLKIHRSHLIQAFLFDHIQPQMPAFNTNSFKLASTSQHLTQYHYLASEHTQNLLDELVKVENQHRNQIKVAKRASKKIQQKILENRDNTMKGSLAEQQDLMALQEFKVKDSDQNLMNLFMFSKQVDCLYNEITEFDQCFPEEADLQKQVENVE